MSIFQFILAYDFDRPEAKILCDLIYVANKYRMEPNVVTFSIPKVLDQRPDIEDDPNTYIPAKVSPKFDSRLAKGQTGFRYTRLPLAALRTVDDHVIYAPPVPFKTYDILPQINQQLGVQLTEDDLENITYTTMNDDFIIRTKPTSRIWIGWRYLQVSGGGKKNLLFPNFMLYGHITATAVLADKKAQLTQIANHDNSVTRQEMIDFDFGNIEGGVIGASGRNTRIYIHAHKQGYIDQWLYYTRIDPKTINDQFVGGVPPEAEIPNELFTIYGVLDKINTALNLQLTVDDVENAAFLPGLKQIPIKFKSTSLGWLPGTYTVQVKYVEATPANLRLVDDGSHRTINGTEPRTYQDQSV